MESGSRKKEKVMLLCLYEDQRITLRIHFHLMPPNPESFYFLQQPITTQTNGIAQNNFKFHMLWNNTELRIQARS